MEKLKEIFSYTLLVLLVSVIIFKYNNNLYSYVDNNLSNVVKSLDEDEEIKLLFVGDMMFDRNVAKYARKNGQDFIFSKVEDMFEDKIVIGNLEGTITDNPSIAEVDNTVLRFTFNKTYADLLKKYNFQIVSLANNHSLDFYRSGYEETTQNLERVGISYFGSAKNDSNISLKTLQNGKILCFIGYHDLYTWNEKPVLDEINNIKEECYKIIVFTHWGDEYKLRENKRQRDLAHKFIDNGAHIIIGSHPHVVEPLEMYNGKPIFYSLGNFVFDQNFSFNTTRGVVIDVSLRDTKETYKFTPIKVVNGQVERANKEDSGKIIDYITGGDLIDEIKNNIKEKMEFSLYN